MTTTAPANARADARPSAAPAWIAVVLTPFGVLAGVAVAYAMAAIIGVTLDPATGPGPSFSERLFVWSVASIVWVAAPASAVLLARRSAREKSRSGVAALVVSCGFLVLTSILSVWAIAVP